MRRPLLLATLFLTPAPAFALGEEAFGNAPRVKQTQWADGVVEVVNLRSRVYCRWVNGNESFYYSGDAKALNEALKAFAEIKDDQKSLVILPGKGETKSFQGKSVPYDWELHVPTGIYRSVTKETHPTLTVYIPSPRPANLADPKSAEKWITELDSSIFGEREAAETELRKLGRSAKVILKDALTKQPSAEQQLRINKLLKDLPGYDLGDLTIPQGLTPLGPDDLIETNKKGMTDANTDHTRRAFAVDKLGSLARFDDKIVALLVNRLDPEVNEYSRRMAAYALGNAGVLARSALPHLKSHQDDPDKNVATACKTAIEQIENAKESPTAEADAKATKAILKDIQELKKGHAKK